jgi:hypothetical protein
VYYNWKDAWTMFGSVLLYTFVPTFQGETLTLVGMVHFNSKRLYKFETTMTETPVVLTVGNNEPQKKKQTAQTLKEEAETRERAAFQTAKNKLKKFSHHARNFVQRESLSEEVLAVLRRQRENLNTLPTTGVPHSPYLLNLQSSRQCVPSSPNLSVLSTSDNNKTDGKGGKRKEAPTEKSGKGEKRKEPPTEKSGKGGKRKEAPTEKSGKTKRRCNTQEATEQCISSTQTKKRKDAPSDNVNEGTKRRKETATITQHDNATLVTLKRTKRKEISPTTTTTTTATATTTTAVEEEKTSKRRRTEATTSVQKRKRAVINNNDSVEKKKKKKKQATQERETIVQEPSSRMDNDNIFNLSLLAEAAQEIQLASTPQSSSESTQRRSLRSTSTQACSSASSQQRNNSTATKQRATCSGIEKK